VHGAPLQGGLLLCSQSVEPIALPPPVADALAAGAGGGGAEAEAQGAAALCDMCQGIAFDSRLIPLRLMHSHHYRHAGSAGGYTNAGEVVLSVGAPFDIEAGRGGHTWLCRMSQLVRKGRAGASHILMRSDLEVVGGEIVSVRCELRRENGNSADTAAVTNFCSFNPLALQDLLRLPPLGDPQHGVHDTPERRTPADARRPTAADDEHRQASSGSGLKAKMQAIKRAVTPDKTSRPGSRGSLGSRGSAAKSFFSDRDSNNNNIYSAGREDRPQSRGHSSRSSVVSRKDSSRSVGSEREQQLVDDTQEGMADTSALLESALAQLDAEMPQYLIDIENREARLWWYQYIAAESASSDSVTQALVDWMKSQRPELGHAECAIHAAAFVHSMDYDHDDEISGEGTRMSVELCGPHVAISPVMVRSSNEDGISALELNRFVKEGHGFTVESIRSYEVPREAFAHVLPRVTPTAMPTLRTDTCHL